MQQEIRIFQLEHTTLEQIHRLCICCSVAEVQLVYRDEVPPPAVDVHIVIVHTDQLGGLCHEEGSAAELRMLRCEGELTLHCYHVQTT